MATYMKNSACLLNITAYFKPDKRDKELHEFDFSHQALFFIFLGLPPDETISRLAE